MFLIFYILLMSYMTDLVTLAIGAGGVIATIIVAVFYQSILTRIADKRDHDKLYDELDKAIEIEAQAYLKEKPIKKKEILSRLSTLDYFRIQLGKAEDTANMGVILLGIGIVIIFLVTAFTQNVPFSALFNDTVTYIIVNYTTHTAVINNGNVSPLQIIFWIGFYVAAIFIAFSFSNFRVVWKIGKVITRRYGQRDEDIAGVVCMFFQRKGGIKNNSY